jgi:hypothetical protein
MIVFKEFAGHLSLYCEWALTMSIIKHKIASIHRNPKHTWLDVLGTYISNHSPFVLVVILRVITSCGPSPEGDWIFLRGKHVDMSSIHTLSGQSTGENANLCIR